MKRILEIIAGLVIVVVLFGGYGDGIHPFRHSIEYITSNAVFQFIITIALIILASRLIAGKTKDHSKFFYNLLVKLFGAPQKRKNI